MRTLGIGILSLLVGVSVASANPHAGKWHQESTDELVKKYKIDDQHAKQMRDLDAQITTKRDEWKKARTALREELMSSKNDTTVHQDLLNKFKSTQSLGDEYKELKFKRRLAFHEALTPEKLEQLQAQHRAEFKEHGRDDHDKKTHRHSMHEFRGDDDDDEE